MDAEKMHPLEAMLRRCAQEAPKPWYPRVDAQRLGAPLEEVYRVLELLFLSNLVEKAPGSPETGPGVVLSPLGVEVLQDDEMLQRLREGRALGPNDHGGAIREMIYRPRPPLVTRMLMFAIFACFAYSIFLAWQVGVVTQFLSINPFQGIVSPSVEKVLVRSGAVNGVLLVHHEWIRLLTAPFVHFGVIFFLLVLWSLGSACTRAEQMWGREKFLLLYFFSALSGFIVSVGLHPLAGVQVPPMGPPTLGGLQGGAMEALCGLLGAEIVWVLINGRYLPSAMRKTWRFGLFLNLAIFALFCFLPGIGYIGLVSAHLAGVAMGLLLIYHQFAPNPWRWLIVPLLALFPLAALLFLEQQRKENRQWHEAEEREFALFYEMPVAEAQKAYKVNVKDVAATQPIFRDRAEVKKALAVVAKELGTLRTLQTDLPRAGPYYDPAVAKKPAALQEMIEKLIKNFTDDEKNLRDGQEKEKEREKKEEKREEEFEKKYLPLLDRVVKQADKVFTDKLRALTSKSAADRDRNEVAAMVVRLADVSKQLADVQDVFLRLRRYNDKATEEAAEAGRDYLAAAREHVALAERCLRGDGWKEEDNAKLKEKSAEVERLRAKLRELF
jgi:membrane associated rhomboid family serine protease